MQRSNMSEMLLNMCRNQPKPTIELAFYSIKTCIPSATTKGLILGMSIKAHLVNLSDVDPDHLNYPSMGMTISS